MEYIVGSLMTIVVAVVTMIIAKIVINNKTHSLVIRYSQSNVYERIKPAIPFMPPQKKECQSSNHKASQMVRIIMVGSMAYWISDNQVLQAPVSPEGFVDQTMATPIDTMGMDKVELEEIAFIVQKLTEGKN
jgi:hypothetical protein